MGKQGRRSGRKPPRREEFTYREFADFVKDGVERAGAGFEKPDDDWRPILHVHTGRGDLHIVLLHLETSQERSEAVVEFIRRLRARKVALVESCWLGEGAGPPPVERPDRIEALMVGVHDAERSEIWTARIARDGKNPPTLGAWEGPELNMTGRLIDPLKEALR